MCVGWCNLAVIPFVLVIRSSSSSQTWNGHFPVQTMGTSQLAKQQLFEGCPYSPAQCVLQLVRDSMADNGNSSATTCSVSLVPDVDINIRVKDTDICVPSKGQALQVLDDRASGFRPQNMWGKFFAIVFTCWLCCFLFPH